MIYDYIIEQYTENSEGCIDFKAFMKAMLIMHRSSRGEREIIWLKFAMFTASNAYLILEKDLHQMTLVSMLTQYVSDTNVIIQT